MKLKILIKKSSLLLLMVVLVVSTVIGCGKSTAETASKEADSNAEVKIGFAKGSLCLAPIHLAYLNGYFEEEFKAAGVSWKMEEVDLSQAAELLAAGKINAAVGLTASLIQPIDNGLDITFTTGLHTGCTKYYVAADSGINSVADLKGKKIGVPGLSDSSTMNIKRKLNDVGIGVTTDNMEVTLVPYALTDLPLALANGAVDAVALHDPVAYKAEEEYGFKKILDTAIDEKFLGEYCCESYVTIDLATKNPKAAAAYTRAMQKAAAFIQASPKEAAKIQIDSGYCSGDLETNAQLLDSYNYSPSVSGGLETFKAAALELKTIGDLKQDTDVEAFSSVHFTKLEGVPDSITYDTAAKKFVSK
ncbi:ABC transporter substrate-binding protein [Ruminiclostridium herbifermentans]|uniref:ABC transporter substrate-binding protein n=1 Tax=Ruminiclostridium herbifermentans TaxID=2488810 RepID=A0A4V6EPC9_9FIRM|nr:ABC transporter substrate-binding protein [Ruminiclostridium herbifermentans]QNU68594.1 ABC transporter substrate-binding protein [Ruminiclostridium herbifermentans]